MRPSSAALLASFLTCAVASAQINSLTPAFLPEADTWPISAGAFTRCAAGQMTSDGVLDVALVFDGDVWFRYGAGTYAGAYQVTTIGDVRDVVALPGVNTNGRDVFLSVSETDGLQRWKVVEDANSNPPETEVEPDGTLNDSCWKDVVMLAVGDFDGDGSADDVAGLLESQLGVLRMLDAAGTYSSASGYSWTSPSPPMREIVAVEWDSDTMDEIAGTGASGPALLDPGESPLVTALGYGTLAMDFSAPSAVQRVRTSSAPDDLALIARGNNQQYDFVIVISQGGVETPMRLTGLSPVGIAAADLDGNGNDDLVVTTAEQHRALVLLHHASSTTPTYAITQGNHDWLEMSTSQDLQNASWPLIGDLDGDGDADVFLADALTDQIFRFENSGVIDADDLRVGEVVGDSVVYDAGVLSPTFTVPAQVGDATHLDVILWQSHTDPNDPVGALPPVDDVALDHQRFDLEDGDEFTPDFENVMLDSTGLNQFFVVEARLVKVDANGRVTRAFPPLLRACLRADDTDVLASLIGTGVTPPSPPTVPVGVDKPEVGKWVPLKKVPPFHPSEVPFPGVPSQQP